MHEYAPFAVTLLVILAGILLNRNDTKELRAEIGSLRSELKGDIGSLRTELKTEFRSEIGSFRAEVNAKLTKIQDDLNSFHRSLGQHDNAIEIL